MKNIVKTMKSIWKDESAQGATEYILLLVVVVAIAFIFKNKIREIVTGKLDSISGDIQGFTSGGGGN